MRSVVTVIFAAAAAVGTAPAQDMLGVTYGGTVWAVDSRTGVGTPVAAGLFGHDCLARDENGDLWTIGRTLLGTPAYFLTRLDPSSLELEIVAPARDTRALADAGNGELFAIEFVPGNGQLFRIDTATGARTFVGATGVDIEGLAVREGVLYAWSTSHGLGVLDPGTGAFADVGGPGSNDIRWLAVRDDGELVGGETGWFVIDPFTGTAKRYAQGNVALRGAEASGMVLPYGQGCGGVALRAAGSLRAGSLLTTLSTGYPSTGATVGHAGALLVGSSRTEFQNVPLPLLLDPLLGTTGCSLYTSIDNAVLGFTTGGVAPSFFYPVQLPASVANRTFFVQHAGLSVTGASWWSNGLLVRVGR